MSDYQAQGVTTDPSLVDVSIQKTMGSHFLSWEDREIGE